MYNIYIDSSGDTGKKFNAGSSNCYVINFFIENDEDNEYNIDVLNNIKFMMNTKPKVEIKYATLRKHKRTEELHKELGKLKGKAFFYVVLKEKLPIESFENAFTLGHAVPIEFISDYIDPVQINRIYIDHYKSPEEKIISMVFGLIKRNTVTPDLFKSKMQFVDSKKINLIQISDFLSGAMRYLFETSGPFQPCNPCRVIRKFDKRICGKVVQKNPFPHLDKIKAFKNIIHSTPVGNKHIKEMYVSSGIYLNPGSFTHAYGYIDCYL